MKELILPIIAREFVFLVYKILKDYSYRVDSMKDLEKRLWLEVHEGNRLVFWIDIKELPDRKVAFGFQYKSIQVEEGDKAKSLDLFSKKYLEPTAWEICLQAIPKEILNYLAT